MFYAFITKGKIPAYLGSSFAYLAPSFLLMSQGYDFQTIQSGFFVSGLAFALVATIIYFTGTKWINKLFPPAAMGAIVTIIGLELAPTAADMAGFAVGGSNNPEVTNMTWVIISMVTLVTVILCNVLLRGFLKIIPILIGVVVGYITAYFMGEVNFEAVQKATPEKLGIPNAEIAQKS